jgi:pimeloyl-ACP methyl ester carboxylesterase
VSGVDLKREGDLAYREALPSSQSEADPVLLLHGFPETSYMWRGVMPAIADEAGRRAIALDFPGCGDSPPDPPATWERHMDAVERLCDGLGLDSVGVVVHDWGGLIGLRWACDHPGRASAIVASNTGLFPDGRWHGMAKALRTEGQGEEIIAAMTREGLSEMMRGLVPGFEEGAADEYWKSYETDEGRQGVLEMYRSGDFEKLEPYKGKLAELGVPLLCLWGENDAFAPPAGAFRFKKEVPGTEVVLVDGAGHFVYDEQPERCAHELVKFLTKLER